MPEYLAPGVYIEEVELGPRAIQAVSTSTTGFVGITRRGPVNKPTLVTNFGEFERFFGGYLEPDPWDGSRWMPYSVQGFFANGGSRAYIVRVAPLPRTDEERADRDNFAQVAEAVLPNQQLARRSLAAPAAEGATKIELAYSGGLPVGATLVIGDGDTAEAVRVTGFSDAVDVEPALAHDHDAGEGAMEMELPADPSAALNGRPPNTEQAKSIRVHELEALEDDRWVRIESGQIDEFVQLGTVPAGTGTGDAPTVQALAQSHDAGAVVTVAEAPNAAPSATLDGDVAAAATTIKLDSAGALVQGDFVILEGADAASAEVVRLTETPTAQNLDVAIDRPLRFAHADGGAVTRLTFSELPPAPHTTLVPGLRFDAQLDVHAGDQVLVDVGAGAEFVRLASDPDQQNRVSLTRALRFPHDDGADVRIVAVPDTTTTLTAAGGVAAEELVADSVDDLAAGDVIEVLDGEQTEYVGILAIQQKTLTLDREMRYAHGAGTVIRRLAGAIHVIAGPMTPDPDFYPEPGSWGNDVRLQTEASSALTTQASAAAVQGDAFVQLRAVTGIAPGTVLRFPGNAYAAVSRVEGKRVFLEGGAPVALDPAAAGPNAWRGQVSTQEFKLTVSYGGTDEVFDGLSMDTRHPRHFARVINADSQIVHVDAIAGAPPPPENLPLAGVRWPGGGSDGLGGVGAATFIGSDNADADRRTGLFAMHNQSGISIAAVPGITDDNVQLALIAHCEAARYRFAVLDPHEGASLDAVQQQRNLFDSQYAALYYPWLKIFDPVTNAPTYAPPSGYVAGLYARTDQDVGVHKAPANAVLRQVLDLQFTVGKGQQDVLNPKGINAIRAFPNRGIRVWGARTISSDSPWRYVNVRRLFIMLEQSIDESTQYAVFEPNDVPLWNRLKASVTAFLTIVWRQGALQGTTEDEAFFVRCGLGETMIQADIDAGQVIMVIGVAPVKPAEFVIFRIGQKAGPAPA